MANLVFHVLLFDLKTFKTDLIGKNDSGSNIWKFSKDGVSL